eukprot:2506518-Alexandrium_andersonii.AAC.1
MMERRQRPSLHARIRFRRGPCGGQGSRSTSDWPTSADSSAVPPPHVYPVSPRPCGVLSCAA